MTHEEKRALSQELNFKMILLQQRLAVLDELLLHSSQKLNAETAKYYVAVLNKYGNFFNAVTESLKTSFYVEFLAYLGIKLNSKSEIINDKYAEASVYDLAVQHDAKDEYTELIKKHKAELVLLDEVRHYIAHAKDRKELNNLHVPGYNRTVQLMNEVSGFVMKIHDELHGIPGLNSPHILEGENEYSEDTEQLINAISTSAKSKTMREKYLQAKQNMRKQK